MQNAQESPPALTDAEKVWLSMFEEAGVGIGWRVWVEYGVRTTEYS